MGHSWSAAISRSVNRSLTRNSRGPGTTAGQPRKYERRERTREIGLRIAIGAQWVQVMTLVLRRSVTLIVVGLSLGLAGSAAVTRYLQGMLFGLTALDPSTFVAVAVLFGGVAFVATYVPARRATNVDPIVALRCE